MTRQRETRKEVVFCEKAFCRNRADVVDFANQSAALEWLTFFGRNSPIHEHQLRMAAHHSGLPDIRKLPDQAVIAYLSRECSSGTLHVHVRVGRSVIGEEQSDDFDSPPPQLPASQLPRKSVANPNEGTRNPNRETTVTDNQIDFVFDPAKSAKVKKCDRIVHVQFIRMKVDGKVIKPGTYYSGYSARDSATTSKGWYVDPSDTGFTTPDYQQSGTSQAIGNEGAKNGSVTKAKTQDVPQTGGGDKGFYNKTSNPHGWKEVRYEFATFAYCMAGPDCGKWYEGVKWNYTKTWKDQKDGSDGTSKISDKSVDAPSKDHRDAFDLFNKRESFVPCP